MSKVRPWGALSGEKQGPMAGKITYCLSYPLVLTRACENRCGYCRFPVVEPGRLPSPRTVRRHLHEAVGRGATQIELIAGEGITTDPDIVAMVRYYGFDSYQSYLTRILEMIEATDRQSPLFSLLNVGPLSLAELCVMRPYLCALRIMLESADVTLQFREAHREAPSKSPDHRLEAILCCGKAGVPLTTGILVGIGESRASRMKAFEIIARANERYGHIQAVRLQMFHPLSGTPMAEASEVSDEEFLETVAMARRHFGSRVAIQISADEHPHLIGGLLDAGVSDFGDLSVRGSGNQNAGQCRKTAAESVSIASLTATMATESEKRGLVLARRFPVYEPYCAARWYPGGFPSRLTRARAVMHEPIQRV